MYKRQAYRREPVWCWAPPPPRWRRPITCLLYTSLCTALGEDIPSVLYQMKKKGLVSVETETSRKVKDHMVELASLAAPAQEVLERLERRRRSADVYKRQVLIMDSDHVVLSALPAEKLAPRLGVRLEDLTEEEA